MILADSRILEYIDCGKLIIEPFVPEAVGPNTIDLRLSGHFKVLRTHGEVAIDPREDSSAMFEEVHKGSGEHFALHPGEFVLGSTLEHITFPDVLAGQLMGKSSLGRLGLVIHQTAGFFDSGFAGNPTLELTNAAPIPIKLYPGMWVAQMGFILVDGKVTRPYGDRPSSKYHNQGVAPETSRMHENFGEQDGR